MSRIAAAATIVAAGGTSDILARQIGPKLTDAWGQPVIVENRPGANGNVGAVGTPESLGTWMRTEQAKWSKVVKESGTRFD